MSLRNVGWGWPEHLYPIMTDPPQQGGTVHPEHVLFRFLGFECFKVSGMHQMSLKEAFSKQLDLK